MDSDRPDRQRALALREAMGSRDLRILRAPGRVNLIGDHTDYNDGFVLPVAIDRDCLIAWRPRRESRLTVRSLDLGGAVDVSADGADDPMSVPGPAWGSFVAGVARALARRGRPPVGIDAAVSSTVPAGSGLSSSTALATALALAMSDAAGVVLPARDLALAGQEAELLATGVPGGVMDQIASLCGQAEHALFIDCRTLAIEPVPLPPGIAMLVVHSGLPRTLADSAYTARQAECAAAAEQLGLRSLRDARPEQVAGTPRARHVVSENERVVDTVAALRAGNVAALGPLLLSSHASLRDDYEVSTPELDLLVDLLVSAGALGARLTGAGFGGCVVALVDEASAGAVAAGIEPRYRAGTGLEPVAFVVRAVDGAGPVT